LFTDRARHVRPEFAVTEDNAAAVTEICRRLDGMPLAIELAAARVRALSLTEILDSLHDRFRLLTGGARTAVRRQQTLRASVDWSHALLTEPEHILFRRLAAFMGGFDLDAAQAVGGSGQVERYQVLDQLTLLVDKSLVVTEDNRGRTRYRLLETVRQYALEKLSESGEADPVRTRHRDYYTVMAALLDTTAQASHGWRIGQAETEIDNLRAAFAWSRENSDIELALQLASSLYPLWVSRGRLREGLAWFDSALADDKARYPGVGDAAWGRALADKAMVAASANDPDGVDHAQKALAIARELGDPALLVRALTACGSTAVINAEVAGPYFAEAIGLARGLGDGWRLSQILSWQEQAAFFAGDPIAARVAAEEGRDLADAIGDRFVSRSCRWGFGWAQMIAGDLAGAAAQFREMAAEADSDADAIWSFSGLFNQAHALAYQGDTRAARAAADAAIEAAAELGGAYEGFRYLALSIAALAAGDVAAADEANEAAWRHISLELEMSKINIWRRAQAALAHGDLIAARRWADDAVSATTGWHLMIALTTRARVGIAQGQPEQAERDAHDALASAAGIDAQLGVPDILECLAGLAGEAGSHREAARLLGAAAAMRQRTGEVRFKIYEADNQAAVAALRDAIGEKDFDDARAEGAALSTDEAIAYAQRGRGKRKRPTSGWASLTPAERDVIRLVSEGLSTNDIATRLFISPRTVQTHLTHVYTKLGLTSRVQLAQEAARHA
jgi:DNA-binding CsgD family transcriptional regulator/tetratricopeptide (TPR) repeat protein